MSHDKPHRTGLNNRFPGILRRTFSNRELIAFGDMFHIVFLQQTNGDRQRMAAWWRVTSTLGPRLVTCFSEESVRTYPHCYCVRLDDEYLEVDRFKERLALDLCQYVSLTAHVRFLARQSTPRRQLVHQLLKASHHHLTFSHLYILNFSPCRWASRVGYFTTTSPSPFEHACKLSPLLYIFGCVTVTYEKLLKAHSVIYAACTQPLRCSRSGGRCLPRG